jgi:uncharacterized lipoprotein YehR (DUF1307 family)
MKKLLIVIAMATLALGLTGCGEEAAPENTSYNMTKDGVVYETTRVQDGDRIVVTCQEW